MRMRQSIQTTVILLCTLSSYHSHSLPRLLPRAFSGLKDAEAATELAKGAHVPSTQAGLVVDPSTSVLKRPADKPLISPNDPNHPSTEISPSFDQPKKTLGELFKEEDKENSIAKDKQVGDAITPAAESNSAAFDDGVAKLKNALGGEFDLKLTNGKPLSVLSLTDYLLPEHASYSEWREMRNFLFLIQRQARDDHDIQALMTRWGETVGRIRVGPTHLESQTTAEIENFIKGLNPDEFIKKFDPEYKAALETIDKRIEGRLNPRPDSYFQTLFPATQKDKQVLDLKYFAWARANQKKLPQNILEGTTFSKPEDVVQILPKEFDLETMLFRYTMVEGFSNILREIEDVTTPTIRRELRGKITPKLIQSIPPTSIDSVFSSTAKEDILWREKLFAQVHAATPSTIFKRLQESTDDASRIKHALDTKAESLSFLESKDFETLHAASSNRRDFRKQLRVLEATVQERNEQAMSRELEMLERLKNTILGVQVKINALEREAKSSPFLSEEDLVQLKLVISNPEALQSKLGEIEQLMRQRKDVKVQKELDAIAQFREEAINSNPINYPYVEQLYNSKLIDANTRAKLIPDKKMTQSEFLNALGTEEQFTKNLMDRFQQNLINYVRNAPSSQESLSELVNRLTSAYINQLTTRAQAIYLKPDAFMKPDSFKFDEALDVFSPDAIQGLLARPVDNKELAKAYLEASAPLASVRRPGRLQEFFDEINIQPTHSSIDHQGGITDLLSEYDNRLYAIYMRPLTEGDSRLQGTKYERLSKQGRQGLNTLAEYLYSNFERLDQVALRNEETSKKIKEIESQFSIEKKERIGKLIQDLERTTPPLQEISHIFTQKQLDKLNQRVAKLQQGSRQPKFQLLKAFQKNFNKDRGFFNRFDNKFKSQINLFKSKVKKSFVQFKKILKNLGKYLLDRLKHP